MIKANKHIAVLTGDLIGSRSLQGNNLTSCIKALNQTAIDLADITGNSLHFSRHRGDGWQVVITKPEFAPRAALAFRTSLKALGKNFDSYIGIAEGIQSDPLPTDLNEAIGQVFVDSGFALDQIKQGKSDARMATSTRHHKMEALLLPLEFIFNGWTEKQAEAIYLNLVQKNYSMNERASELGITRQALEKRLKSAGALYVHQALQIWEIHWNQPND